MTRLTVLGSGGHAKVAVATLLDAGFEIVAIVDDNQAAWGTELLGIEVSGPCRPVLDDPSATAIIAIGSNRVRQTMASSAKCQFATAIHPTAYVHPTVTIGEGTVVFAGTVIQPDTRIGAHAIINTSASIDHDCHIGSFAHLGPGVHLAGDVEIGEGGFLGVGTSVIPGQTIGEWTTVGAGAAVIRDLPAHVIAVGVPAAVRS